MKRWIYTADILVSVIFSLRLWAVELLTEKGEYYNTVVNCIENAKESIYLKMYLFTEPRLLEKLKDAHTRGIEIKVILDKAYEGDAKNEKAYNFLKKRGIPVSYDSVSTLTHTKLVIIDKRLIVLGSYNWTYTSLFINNEAGAILEQDEIDEKNISILDENNFLPFVFSEIRKAKESITVVMYRFERKTTGPLSLIFNELVSAKKRGVVVSVILDQQFRSYFDYMGGRKAVPTKDNFPVAMALLKEGIKADFDSVAKITHAKLLIIDRETVILGSQDLAENTPSPLKRSHPFCEKGNEYPVPRKKRGPPLLQKGNLETEYRATSNELEKGNYRQISIIVKSHDIALRAEAFVKKIQLEESIIPLALQEEPTGIRLPHSFLIAKNGSSPGEKITNRGSKRYLNLYLRLLVAGYCQKNEIAECRVRGNDKTTKENTPSPAKSGVHPFYKRGIKIDYEKLGRDIGLDREHIQNKTGKYYRNYYVQELDRLLRKLEELGLIKYNKDKKEVYLVGDAFPDKDYFVVPYNFFACGWDKKLSLKAEYLYLISLFEKSLHPKRPWWSRSYQGIKKLYKIEMNTIWEAVLELQRQNILEVYRTAWSPDKAFSSREKNKYFLNPIPDPGELQAKWKDMQKAYGEKVFQAAVLFSDSMDEPNDPWVVETFCGLILQYGEEKTRAANSITTRFRRSYGKRNIGYTIGILGRWEK